MRNDLILIYSDLAILDTTQEILKKQFKVISTNDPIKGLKLLLSHGPFAVIITDCREIDLNAQFLRQITELSPDARRIMIADCTFSANFYNLASPGMVYTLMYRPVVQEKLLLIVQAAVEGYNQYLNQKLKQIEMDNIAKYLSKYKRNNCYTHELTQQERKIMNMIADGCTNSEIAVKLNVRLGTVKAHCNNIYNKLGVNSRTQAIAKAIQSSVL